MLRGNRTRFTHGFDDRSVNYVAGASCREREREKERSLRELQLRLRWKFLFPVPGVRLSFPFARNIPRTVESFLFARRNGSVSGNIKANSQQRTARPELMTLRVASRAFSSGYPACLRVEKSIMTVIDVGLVAENVSTAPSPRGNSDR